MTLKPSAVALLQRVARRIVRMPETFDMRDFLSHDPLWRGSKKRPAPYCGTVACIAGHILLDGRKRVPGRWVDGEELDVDYEGLAARRLGLSSAETAPLFFQNRWPVQFLGLESAPNRAAARIEYFIRTGA